MGLATALENLQQNKAYTKNMMVRGVGPRMSSRVGLTNWGKVWRPFLFFSLQINFKAWFHVWATKYMHASNFD